MGLFFRDYTPVQICNTFGSPLELHLELPKGSRLKFWEIFVNRHLTLKCTPVPPWGAPAGTPVDYHGGCEPVDSLITHGVLKGVTHGGT